MNNSKPGIALSEIFGPTIQGEGVGTGKPVYFLRLGGCDFRCRWCDTKYAVLPKYIKYLPRYTAEELSEIVLQQIPPGATIVLTGGNPAIYDLNRFLDLIEDHYRITLESQGSIWQDWMERLDLVTFSPKPPSSKVHFDEMVYIKNIEHAHRMSVQFSLKIVAFDVEDLIWAQRIAIRSGYQDLHITVGTDLNDSRDTLLARYEELITLSHEVFGPDSLIDWTITPQMHVLVWGQERGV